MGSGLGSVLDREWNPRAFGNPIISTRLFLSPLNDLISGGLFVR